MGIKFSAIILVILSIGLKTGIAAPDNTDEFRVYPNPVVLDELTIEAENEFTKVEILSIVGQVVYTYEQAPSNSVKLDIDLKSGIYLIRLSFTDKTNNIKRIWVN